MNLRHLAIFHAVAKARSVNAAAPLLHTSQPAVSRELRTLEERLKTPLFDRLPRGMRLTEAGEVLFDYAERIFALDQAAERAIQEMSDLQSGQLVIGASNMIGAYLLPGLLARLRERCPGIFMSLEVTNTENVIQGVKELRFSLGFIGRDIADEGVDAQEFQRDRIVAVVAPGHPLAKAEKPKLQALAKLPAILRERGSGTREIVEEAFLKRRLALRCALEIGNSEALKRVVMAGGEVGWISKLCIEDELRARKLVILPTPQLDLDRPLHWVKLHDRALSRSAAAFLDLCL